ncbi:hypothetical protein IMSAGC006_02305 [Muribaculaceae bacterium]|nr:hypothetical protein IMSAGC006_02305 [Muribaculaceae bacterium]
MKDVAELMVHGAEIVLIHLVDVGEIHFVDLEQSHFQTTLCETEGFGAGVGIVGRRTDQVKNSGTIHFQEV